MNPLARLILSAVVICVGTYLAVQLVGTVNSEIAARPKAPELGLVKPWSVHPENRAAFRANPEVLS